ncbi:ethylene-overproduction protein 1-like [Chenopodium quinoa]|uniref:ethylene-overproduction protein 1-like n=1 Tax=Chenopodium quinoa TaxID=63459 RepID=UPI000B77204F|nr:ethylene-overproduction protein 1-like [Chenopodium quinoa]
MQNNILSTMRSLKLIDGCKSSQVYAINPNSATNGGANSGAGNGGGGGVGGIGTGEKLLHQLQDHLRVNSVRSKTRTSSNLDAKILQANLLQEALLPYGLPSTDLVEPQVETCLKFVNFVETLADVYRRTEGCPQFEKSLVYVEQCAIFRGLADSKLFRRSLRSARQHAVDVHTKIVLAAWLRFERREDELTGSSPLDCCGRITECPKASMVSGYDPESAFDECVCHRRRDSGGGNGNEGCGDGVVVGEEGLGGVTRVEDEECSTSEEDFDMSFVVGEEEVKCIRYNIASLSRAFKTLLYGSFVESRREKINFTQNGISVQVIRALELYSRKKKVDSLDPPLVLELLSLANMFCCDELKSACDVYLSSLVIDKESALTLMDYGLEEAASLLVAACLQVFLRDLPGSLHDQNVMKYFCTPEAREKLASTGHSSFLLYYFLSQTAIEEDMKSNIMVMLLERLVETATASWQKQLAFHLLGCVFYERKEYKDAQNSFEAAAEAGHVYSIAGIARTKYKRGHKYTAYKLMNSLISDYKPSGWMYQERSLYCVGKERLADLEKASELDPTLSFPYKYRAIALLEDNKLGAAISEINKIIGFKVTPDCLELRAWFSIAFEDYEGALRDLRALLTLDPDCMMFHGKMPGEQLVELLRSHVQQWSQADCWMQLYDRWSSVDDIGSLAVVHHMLANDPGKSLLRFRQSLLLLRLNCQKAAMRSLRLARNCSTSDHERLVYEGWILYDTGHREEALAKAEESITIQRSFEAFFLKAYALADSNLDEESSSYVIHLLEEALRCPSDGLRKGQALNNLGSVYVDCEKLDLAADCYMNALNIKHTRAHQGLARVYHVRNQRKAAYDEMTKLIEKARNNASAYEKRSEYCDREMAKRDLTMATQLDPLRTYPYRYRAAVLMDDHKEEEAIAELSKAIFFKPDLQLLHLRAAFHDSMGNNAATLRDCEAALSLDPTHVDTLKLYSEARERISDEQLSRCDSMNRKDAPDTHGNLNYASRAFQ